MTRSTRAAGTPAPVRVAGAVIVGFVCAMGGFVLLLGTGRGDPRLFEVWPLLAVATLGLAGAIAAVLYRRTSRQPGAPEPTGSLLRRATADVALVVLITGVLGVTIVVAWVAIGGLEVFQGPAHVSRTRGLLITVLLALLAAGVGAVLTRFRKQRMSTEALIGLGFAAWIGELLVLLVLGPFLADELGRGVGTVVTTWVVATAGVVQPVAFVVGGLVGRHLRRDRVGRSVIAVERPPDNRFGNGFMVHEHTDEPDFPLVEDFTVRAARRDGVAQIRAMRPPHGDGSLGAKD